MASAFELFGLTKQSPTETKVSELGIKNRINSLERASEVFFVVPQDAKATDGNVLAVNVKQRFDVHNANHIQLVQDATKLFEDKSAELKALDQKIGYSCVVGVVASSLSFVPFVSYFALLGWGSALYHGAQREQAFETYQESLKLLVATCNWSLGQSNEEATTLTQHSAIRQMMSNLYPVLTETQVRHLIADEIEEVFAKEQRNYENKYQLSSIGAGFFHGDETIARSKRSAEFIRCIYGYNKGGVNDYLDAVCSILPDLYNEVNHGIKKLQYWWNKKERDEQATSQYTPVNR
jgi:hypothetical protein